MDPEKAKVIDYLAKEFVVEHYATFTEQDVLLIKQAICVGISYQLKQDIKELKAELAQKSITNSCF